jgi:voltage-gated potassium channel Kch
MFRWSVVTLALALLYGLGFSFLDLDYGLHKTALSSYYFSFVTLTTLGYGDVVPKSSWAQLVVMTECVLGYVMLGGLLSIFASKMGRRAD